MKEEIRPGEALRSGETRAEAIEKTLGLLSKWGGWPCSLPGAVSVTYVCVALRVEKKRIIETLIVAAAMVFCVAAVVLSASNHCTSGL